MDWIVSNWDTVLLIVTSIVTLASLIVKLTPTPKDDAILAKIINFFKVIGLYKKGS